MKMVILKFWTKIKQMWKLAKKEKEKEKLRIMWKEGSGEREREKHF